MYYDPNKLKELDKTVMLIPISRNELRVVAISEGTERIHEKLIKEINNEGVSSMRRKSRSM